MRHTDSKEAGKQYLDAGNQQKLQCGNMKEYGYERAVQRELSKNKEKISG